MAEEKVERYAIRPGERKFCGGKQREKGDSHIPHHQNPLCRNPGVQV